MKKIIIDTNALMAMAEFKLDLFRALEEACDFPFRIYVLSGTLNELKGIKTQQRLKFKMRAQLALSLLEFKKIRTIEEKGEAGKVDDLLVAHSREGNLILTQDRELKRRLKKPYLTIRQRKRVVLVW